ncbi:MAG: DUF4097 family beta strand repeat-containing protein [Ilumatobacteraceae bacterium]
MTNSTDLTDQSSLPPPPPPPPGGLVVPDRPGATPPATPPPPGPVVVPPRPGATPPGRTPSGVRVLWKLFALLLVIPGIAWGAYNVVVVLAHEERVETSSYPAAGLTSIDVHSAAGSVRIVGSERSTIDVRAEISDGLRSTGERQEVVGDQLRLRSSCPSVGSDWCSVDYEISVPSGLAISIKANNGLVTVTDTTGGVDIDNDEGSVELTDLSGDIVASTDDGSVRASGLTSATATVDSDNGSVTLEFAAAPTGVTATTDNGSVEVVVPDDGEAYRLDISTDNGGRTAEIPTDPASPRSITLRTDNGSVTARTTAS